MILVEKKSFLFCQFSLVNTGLYIFLVCGLTVPLFWNKGNLSEELWFTDFILSEWWHMYNEYGKCEESLVIRPHPDYVVFKGGGEDIVVQEPTPRL